MIASRSPGVLIYHGTPLSERALAAELVQGFTTACEAMLHAVAHGISHAPTAVRKEPEWFDKSLSCGTRADSEARRYESRDLKCGRGDYSTKGLPRLSLGNGVLESGRRTIVQVCGQTQFVKAVRTTGLKGVETGDSQKACIQPVHGLEWMRNWCTDRIQPTEKRSLLSG